MNEEIVSTILKVTVELAVLARLRLSRALAVTVDSAV